jgi:GNAT superfamily N-acetyltransferase
MPSAENRAAALVIRGRADSDLDEAVAVMAEVHRRDGYPMHWPADPAAWLAASRLIAAWVAVLDGRIVGHVSLSQPGRGDGAPRLAGTVPGPAGVVPGPAGMVPGPAGVAMVSRLFVAPAARGHQAGAALLGQAARAARELGCRPLLDVHSTNTAAIALYERLGWQPLGSCEAVWGEDQVTVLCYAAPGVRPADAG